ncbi:MAG: protein-methionine-sulfoxide reductase catalytic subunit MsrP [Nitrospinae bacterium]|nr:protein-methionine-sulfoxide reductase catalytic subunit MsrP [Nitrospinota bacterium]
MSAIVIPKPWKISENEVTPESVYINRREFVKGMSLLTLYSMLLTTGCTQDKSAIAERPESNLTEFEKKLYPVKLNKKYRLDRRVTEERVAASYNNFYEFSEIKEDPKILAQRLPVRPWTVEVAGLVKKPKTFDVDSLLKTMPVEERLYRLRCVEAWAMAVPWTGFPLKSLLDQVQPKSNATYVKMSTFYKPFTAQGQLAFWQPWPYTEALTVKEAMNELTFMAIGIYGHPLPKQHGAPIRLVVPWKYGFKSIKSIVKIELVDYKPATFWNTLQRTEYDFVANVNPRIPHPRWPQTKEKMIGTDEIRLTRMYNGYGKYVRGLYA